MILAILNVVTPLSIQTFFWNIKSGNKNSNITCDYVGKVKRFSREGDKCSLCLSEKLKILKHIVELNVLNKRRDLISACIETNTYSNSLTQINVVLTYLDATHTSIIFAIISILIIIKLFMFLLLLHY